MIDFHDRLDYYIDGYIFGRLSEEAKEAFEEHFFECDECFYELLLRDSLKNHLETVVDKDSLQEMLGSVGETKGAKQKRQTRSNIIKPRWYRSFKIRHFIAAAIFILIAAPLIYFTHMHIRESATTTNQLANSGRYENLLEISPPIYLGTNRAPASSNESTFNKAMKLFGERKYDEAAALLVKIEKFKPLKSKVDFYLGISYYFLDKPDKAVPLLQSAFNEKPSEKHAWYLAHALLKQGKINEAVEFFKRTISYNGKYASEAREKVDVLSKNIRK